MVCIKNSSYRHLDLVYCVPGLVFGIHNNHVTAKTVISLQIQQIIDLSQRVTLKSVDFRLKPLKL